MSRLAMAQVLARAMQLRDWLVVGGIGIGGFLAITLIAFVYFPRRRRQRGFDFAAAGSVILAGAVALGCVLSIWTHLNGRPLINNGWFLVAVLSALLANRVVDFFRFRFYRTGQDKPKLEFGRGAPFLNDAKDLAQVAGILALSGTSLLRGLMRVLQNPTPLAITLLVLILGWIGICLLLNRWTPWYVNERGISIWGSELIEWSEIRDFEWKHKRGSPHVVLVLRLDDGSQRVAVVKEMQKALQLHLRRHLLVTDARQSAEFAE